MKLHLPAVLVIAAAVGVAGCGAATAQKAAAPRTAAPRTAAPGTATSIALAADAPPVTTSAVRPHFGTPQAAMTYLAAAYNRDDVTALHYVTTPSSFKALMAMRSEAVGLQLKYCTPTGRGDDNCVFRHRYPKSMHDSSYGESDFIAAPAVNPGWYMYLFEDCG